MQPSVMLDDFHLIPPACYVNLSAVLAKFFTGLETLLGRKIARRAAGRGPSTKTPVAGQLKLL